MSAGLSTAAIVGIGGALAGGVAGAMGKKSSSDFQSGIDLSPVGQHEQGYLTNSWNTFNDLWKIQDQGSNAQDMANSTAASRDLASLLGQYSKTGGLPSQGDINTSNDLASKLFANQQTALNQSFSTQNQQANQLAARLGRSVDDPVLQAKMRTGFMNQQAMLDANKGGWATQFSLGMPGQRLGYASQQSDVLGNLASQAMQNRTALLNLGSSLGNQERNFRLATGTKWSNGSQQQGGGLGDALTGAMGGLGTGLDMGGKIGDMFGSDEGPSMDLSQNSNFGPLSSGYVRASSPNSSFGPLSSGYMPASPMASRGIGSFSSAMPSPGQQFFQGQPNNFFGRPMPYGGASGSW